MSSRPGFESAPEDAASRWRDVGTRKSSQAAEFFTQRVPGILLGKEPHVRIAESLGRQVGDAGLQPVLVRAGPHNARGRIISGRETCTFQVCP